MENKQNDIIEELKEKNNVELGKVSNEMTNALNKFSKRMQEIHDELWEADERKIIEKSSNRYKEASQTGNKPEQLKKDVMERSYIMSKEEFQAFCKPKSDPVNHPSHYTDGKIEVIDFIEDKKLNFHLANAVKYISRAGKKDPSKEIEDLKKAQWYLSRYIQKKETEEKLKAGGDIDGDEYLLVDLQKDKFAKKEKDMTVYICSYYFSDIDTGACDTYIDKVFDTEEKAENYIFKRMQDFCKFRMEQCVLNKERAYWEECLNNLTVEKTKDSAQILLKDDGQTYCYYYVDKKVL